VVGGQFVSKMTADRAEGRRDGAARAPAVAQAHDRGHAATDAKRAAAPVLGNQALLGRRTATRFAGPIQRKPLLTAPEDRLEREAEAMAEQAMRRQPLPPVHPLGDGDGGVASLAVALNIPAALRAATGPGARLQDGLRADFEARFGRDFSAVRVHTGPEAADAARGIGAKAYTTGRDIVFGAGRYDPVSPSGQRLIAHELAHVVQQAAAPTRVIARDAADDEIEKIESEKLEIGALLDRCAALDKDLREQMIRKIGDHAGTTHEERQLACLLAAKFQGTMKRADFYNTYHELLERLEKDQARAVLDRVGPEVVGKTSYGGVMIDKRSINNVGMAGAPGSSIRVNEITYVVVDCGVQYKTDPKGGPAKRNNNPGNITVDDNAPAAWSPEIGAYRGRNTEGRFAVFPTYERGRAGAIAWARKRPGLTLIDYFKQYAPASEKGNDPAKYADIVADKVGKAIGKPVTQNTRISEILGDPKATVAMEAFVDGQEIAEGFTAESVTCKPKNDPALPQEVRDFVAGFDKATDNTNDIADKVAAAAAKETHP
jgi:hypothetical protein